MLWLVSMAVAAIFFLFLFFPSCKAAGHGGAPAGPGDPGPGVAGEPGGGQTAAPVTGKLTRAEIEARLRKLAESPPPKNLGMGAECYKMASPPARVEYVCPACGQRTLYAESEGVPWAVMQAVRGGIEACRRQVGDIGGIRFTLDEHAFCRKCAPGVKEPALVLVFRLQGESGDRRVPNVTPEDLRLLREFLAGKDRHQGDNDAETPLLDHVDRLREILVK
ncbi:MAG: hypothetical protein KA419_15075 [Acidobacteria bacterium]|nr:hypothetical protein [Acidobacteriota bacterium]